MPRFQAALFTLAVSGAAARIGGAPTLARDGWRSSAGETCAALLSKGRNTLGGVGGSRNQGTGNGLECRRAFLSLGGVDQLLGELQGVRRARGNGGGEPS